MDNADTFSTAASAAAAPAERIGGRAPARRRSASWRWLLLLAVACGAIGYAVIWPAQRRAPAAPPVDASTIRGAPIDAPVVKPDTTAAAIAALERPVDDDEYRPVSFNVLASYDYDPIYIAESLAERPDEELPDLIPPKIRALDGTRVMLTGFMVPVEIQKERVRTFLLVKNQMVCCFGIAVSMNDWVMVDMEQGKTAPFVQDVLLNAYGVLEVGEKLEDGMVMSIYRLRGDSVEFRSGF
ncbi:MAG: DUF3299 domain-containing protein [Phycisphaerae bacterium]